MESAFFTGVYHIVEIGCFPDLQSRGFSGVCYAWKKRDGTYIVLPYNRDNSLQDDCYLLDARDFSMLFQPSTGSQQNTAAPVPRLRSDAPDLLSIWYEQTVSSHPRSGAFADEQTRHMYSPGAPVRGRSPIFSDENILTPPWHPDDGPQEDEPLPPAAPSRDMVNPGLSQDASEPYSSEYGKEFSAHSEAPLKDESAEPDEREFRSARLEQYMRIKFDDLLRQMDDNPHPELEEEVSRLLMLGSTFSWKQKFMFTEFGLSLRRKRKLDLALRSHKRALSLAPKDEHILFNVARSEYELGNTELAKQFLTEALSVAPDFTVAKNFQKFLLGRT